MIESIYFAMTFVVKIWTDLLKLQQPSFLNYKSCPPRALSLLIHLVPLVLLRNSDSFFVIYPARRFIESIIYNRTFILHIGYGKLLHQIIYSSLLAVHIKNRYVEPYGFLFLNIMQSMACYRIYKLNKIEFTAYYSEIAMHAYLLFCSPSIPLIFNLLTVILSLIVVLQKKRGFSSIKKIKDKPNA